MKQIVLIIFSVVLFNLGCFSQKSTLENPNVWMDRISTHTAEITSLKADFTQEKVLSFLNEPIKSSGQFWFQQPEQIRWEYQQPYPYIIIMNNGLMTVKDEGDEYSTNLSAHKMFGQLNELISGSIQGRLLSEDENYSKSFFEDEEFIIVQFVPKDYDLMDYLKYIEIYFSKNTLNVVTLIMTEPGGDFTKIHFVNSVMNESINEDVFR